MPTAAHQPQQLSRANRQQHRSATRLLSTLALINQTRLGSEIHLGRDPVASVMPLGFTSATQRGMRIRISSFLIFSVSYSAACVANGSRFMSIVDNNSIQQQGY
jgi:hypothetical protein